MRSIKHFCKHLIFALATLILLFLIWLAYLDVYTNHNDVIKVPNFHGIHVMDLDSLVEYYDLRYLIIDSIFDKSKEKGIVVNQDPFADTDVKKNRKIYLTINSLKARKVSFPDVFDLTLRQAVNQLERNGFKIGKLEYQADIATNKVLAFKVNGVFIEIGQELYHGTIVDLVVGQGLGDEKVLIPDLIGLSRKEANIVLKSTSLNIGLEYFDDSVSDSTTAIIYKQYPPAGDKKMISMGSSLDLYLNLSQKDSL